MPFLRLTRDRRGFENTFLLHANLPGARPRLLYWYRTAPGVVMGRAPLDEEAIRTIEEQHPSIDFDWPAILALGEVMIHEDETAPRAEPRGRGRGRGGDRRPAREGRMRPGSATPEADAAIQPADEAPVQGPEGAALAEAGEPEDLAAAAGEPDVPDEAEDVEPEHPTLHGLLESLVGREIATRLRARHSEICARIHQRVDDAASLDRWLRRAEALDPDLWLTPEAILDGVRHADSLFEEIRDDLLH